MSGPSATLLKVPGWRTYKEHLKSNPVLTHTATSTLLWGLGDVCAQRLTMAHRRRVSAGCGEKTRYTMNAPRAGMHACFGGTVMGVIGHQWYNFLDAWVVSNFRRGSAWFVASKVLADSFIWGSMTTTVYFLAMGLAQGDSWPRTAKRVREELPTAFLVELGFWPAVDVLNFKFIPVRHQLLCINLMSMLDTTFLSWIMLALDDTPWTQRLFGADRAACAKDASHIKNAP